MFFVKIAYWSVNVKERWFWTELCGTSERILWYNPGSNSLDFALHLESKFRTEFAVSICYGAGGMKKPVWNRLATICHCRVELHSVWEGVTSFVCVVLPTIIYEFINHKYSKLSSVPANSLNGRMTDQNWIWQMMYLIAQFGIPTAYKRAKTDYF